MLQHDRLHFDSIVYLTVPKIVFGAKPCSLNHVLSGMQKKIILKSPTENIGTVFRPLYRPLVMQFNTIGHTLVICRAHC